MFNTLSVQYALKLGLRDLLGPNLALLQTTHTGKLYEKRLRTKQQALEDISEPEEAAAALDHDADLPR